MARVRLLIVTGFNTFEGFRLPMENRTLLWGLDQANVDWWLYNPWDPAPELLSYDAVLINVYRAHARNFAYYCRNFERTARLAGIPVINTSENIDGLHSFYLSRWRDHGVPCARFERFRAPADLTLDCYPLILRRDGLHRGGAMHLVRNRTEAEAVIEKQHAKAAATYPDLRRPLPVDLAIEFVETGKVDGYYCKWRAYVAGDEVIPAHFIRSRSPLVNFKDAALWAGTCDIDQIFRHQGEPHPNRVLAAAAATGFDLVAIDYSLREDGTYIFWEGNRVRATAGDTHVRWLGIREVDMQYGHAIARLVKKRVAESPWQPRAPEPVLPVVPANPAEFVSSCTAAPAGTSRQL